MYYENIFGWFNSGHKITYDLFVTLCKDDREYNILEIGCFLGRSSMYLAEKIKKSKKNIKLHCVDYFHNRNSQLFFRFGILLSAELTHASVIHSLGLSNN